MNTDALKARLRNQTTEVKIGDTAWKLGKLTVSEARAVFPAAAQDGVDQPQSDSGVAFYSLLLSKTLRECNGEAFGEIDAAELANALTWQELFMLGQAAMEFNGFGESAKKN